jgi:hypothetical protein
MHYQLSTQTIHFGVGYLTLYITVVTIHTVLFNIQ